MQIKAEEEKIEQENESLFAGSSNSSGSLLEDDYGKENHYETSVVNCATIKKPEDLIDKDLLNLLSYIKRLPDVSSDFLEKKSF